MMQTSEAKCFANSPEFPSRRWNQGILGIPENPGRQIITFRSVLFADLRHLDQVVLVCVLLQPWVLVFQDSQAVQAHPVYPESTQ